MDIKRKIFRGVRVCNNCNSKIFTEGYNYEDRITMMMRTEGVCYSCAYWKNIINYPLTYMEIIGNRCFRILPEVKKKDKSLLLGGNGKLRYFARYDLSIVRSNDVWSIGVIPEIFRKQLVPTITEISRRSYEKLLKNKNKCSARGCFDRYHCLRYKLELEQDSIGAFNKVPPTWKVGNERCKDFINLTEISNDDSSVEK